MTNNLLEKRAEGAGQPDIPRESIAAGVSESRHHGILVLSPTSGKASRRILFVNSYGGKKVWEQIKRGELPPQHLWGCIELVKMGYEVAIAEPVPHFYLYRRPLPHDLRFLRFAQDWLRPGDIIYSGHTLLYWLPLLKSLRILKRHIVSLTYAREELDFSGAHSGIIALTPAAADQARKMAPRAKIAHLSWGADVNFYPALPYRPNYFLSCGITHRDHGTLSGAAKQSGVPVRVICPERPKGVDWPSNVELVEAGKGICTENKSVSYSDLMRVHYAGASASMIILNYDPTEYTAVGFTNVIEAMAMGRPIILTRTGAVPGEIDVEKMGCGLFVPPADSKALAQAMESILREPEKAAAMGHAGRRLVETHYNIQRFARELHAFFESL